MVPASRRLQPRAHWPHVRRMAGTPAATFTVVVPFTVTSSPGQGLTLPFSVALLRLPVPAPNLLRQASLPVDLRVPTGMTPLIRRPRPGLASSFLPTAGLLRHTAPKGSVAESASIYRGSRWHQWRSL